MKNIIDRYKDAMNDIPDDSNKITYAKLTDESLQEPQAMIDRFIEKSKLKNYWFHEKITVGEAGKPIAALKGNDARRMVLALLSRLYPAQQKMNSIRKENTDIRSQSGTYVEYYFLHKFLDEILLAMLRSKLPFTESDITLLLDYIILTMHGKFLNYAGSVSSVVKAVENLAKEAPLSESICEQLKVINRAFQNKSNNSTIERKIHTRVVSLLGEQAELNILPGEAWSDVAIQYIQTLNEQARNNWFALLQHYQSASATSPNAAWKTSAQKLLDTVGFAQFKDCITRWFPLVDKPRTVPITEQTRLGADPNLMINEQNMDVLKGLAWCAGFREDDAIAKAINRLAITSYKKVPNIGPRATRVGNACVYALGEMPGMVGVYQLALLKIRVNFRTALKGIEKSLAVAGERVGMTVEELEEIGVPAYGLTDVGYLRETMGEVTAELIVTGTTSTELRWLNADGKVLKTAPKSVTDNFAEEAKELKTAAKDIQRMLPAQRQRLDNLYLQQRRWDFAKWKQYYLDHPLMGYLVRRLIWTFSNDKNVVLGIFHDDQLVDVQGKTLANIQDNTQVTLWHPIESDVNDIKAWREWLENHEVIQPFKQAHREIYLLTDAERTTNVYSNRFAAHLIKQHQFNALTVQRGWKYALQGCWDAPKDSARLELPKWGLWAEFWVDGVGAYGENTSEAGVYHYIATDQVRFYTRSATLNPNNVQWSSTNTQEGPTPLADIPPLVLSEVFRDIDLFVGVCSVGNDAEWSDGGPEGRFRDYWASYSFGDLNATAKTRKDVLAGLVPRLKIANRCEVTDKFLVVKGDIRTYKIHLGSGNILMTPNDQYLCIVVARGDKADDNKIYLPFEGDSMLSIILSKAFLLAEDKKIKDTTILNQINS